MSEQPPSWAVQRARDTMMRGFGTPEERLDLKDRVDRTAGLVARALAETRREALEEAEKECDRYAMFGAGSASVWCRDAIRALKTSPRVAQRDKEPGA